ncbi:DUF938 domain-containing protein [Alteromonas sp. ASW11-36]|uniref:DUF938 domain-containing protein n=1 Tax=Alteromonas arenosi TaxID=3055817 RepID=A0ABT7SV75_9ALTE|nr:DUF938 domain-containing protein [Alteromonas sp. ASW11-36]MDM7860097.1 DUF938 domain-containing protein [Alteromonas sp. ASW11-36]
MVNKPFSQACENNKAPILAQLQRHFAKATSVLEIGSGTGQHAVHFAAGLPHLQWHTSDQPHYHAGIEAWLNEAGLANLHSPVNFTVGLDTWPNIHIDAVFSANTAHIMQHDEVKVMQQVVAERLPQNGVFCQYGPFTTNGVFDGQSNADFHQYLLSEGCGGYRDISELQAWAPQLTLSENIVMPANNRLLVWFKGK